MHRGCFLDANVFSITSSFCHWPQHPTDHRLSAYIHGNYLEAPQKQRTHAPTLFVGVVWCCCGSRLGAKIKLTPKNSSNGTPAVCLFLCLLRSAPPHCRITIVPDATTMTATSLPFRKQATMHDGVSRAQSRIVASSWLSPSIATEANGRSPACSVAGRRRQGHAQAPSRLVVVVHPVPAPPRTRALETSTCPIHAASSKPPGGARRLGRPGPGLLGTTCLESKRK